jgi:hypothetical protein
LPRRHRAAHRKRPPERPLRLTPIIVGLPLLLVAAAVTGAVVHGQSPPPAVTVTDAAQQQDANPNCTLIVPADPLSAAGLATPYELTATDQRNGPCRETNPNQTAFVEATVVDPATGALSVFHPLVVDRGTRPAAAPVTPRLPQGAVVGVWFGFNGTTLTLRDARGPQSSLRQGQCVNGLDGSPFGQFAYCDAPAFFTAANDAIKAAKLKIPALGTAADGRPCPSTRDFTLIDQDQSDNVTTSYLVGPGRRTAQNTTANAKRFGTKQTLVNGSDNLLLDAFVDPALGCTPFTAPDIGNGGQPSTSLALDELQAAADQAQPVALVPPNDPMAQVDGKVNVTKVNLYRAGADQPPLGPAGNTVAAARNGDANGNAAVRDAARSYCQNMVDLSPRRLVLDRNLTVRSPSPDKAAANNLFTFLAQRLMNSFTELGCGDLLGSQNPVQVKTNRDGVVVDASIAVPATPPTSVGSAAPPTTARPVDPTAVPDAGSVTADEGDPKTW